MLKNTYKLNPYTLLVISGFTLGIGLLLYQYIYNRSLWLDESMLALNIVDKSFGDLLQPLEYSQVAPILFLLIEKTFTVVFGNNDLALRIFPLLCSIGSLFLIYYLTRSLTGHKAVAVIVLFILACTPYFIYYSSEVKQYATDLFIMLLLYTITFTSNNFLNKYRITALSVMGALAVFLSNTSVIILAIAGTAILYQYIRQRKLISPLLIPLFIWGIFFLINYFLFIKGHPTEAIMKSYWQFAFMPLSPFPTAPAGWLNTRVQQIFNELLPGNGSRELCILFVVLYLTGIALLLLNKKIKIAYLCLAPIAIHLILSALKFYPFDLRLILYQTPLYIIVISFAIYHMSLIFKKHVVIQKGLIVLILACFSFALFNKFPLKNEEIKPIIQQINQADQPDYTLYVYRGAWAAYEYYKKIGYVQFHPKQTIMGESPDASKMMEHMAHFKDVSGHIWLLFSHVFPFDGSRGDERFIVNELLKRGKLLKQFEATGSAGYLIELQSIPQ